MSSSEKDLISKFLFSCVLVFLEGGLSFLFGSSECELDGRAAL